MYGLVCRRISIVNILQSNYNTVCVMSDSKYTNISQLRSASVSQYIFNTFVLLWITSPMRQGAYQRPSPMQKRKRLTWPGLFSLPATWNYPYSMLLLPDDPMSKYLLWWSCAQTKILHNTDAKSLISHQIGQNITKFFLNLFYDPWQYQCWKTSCCRYHLPLLQILSQ